MEEKGREGERRKGRLEESEEERGGEERESSEGEGMIKYFNVFQRIQLDQVDPFDLSFTLALSHVQLTHVISTIHINPPPIVAHSLQ